MEITIDRYLFLLRPPEYRLVGEPLLGEDTFGGDYAPITCIESAYPGGVLEEFELAFILVNVISFH